MMPSIPDTFATDLALLIAEKAAEWVRPKIPSTQLAAAMEVQETTTGARLYIPHYWAIYVHDGRGPFGPFRATYLVWFRNTADDPRLPQAQRYVDVKRLTKDQWLYWLDRNKAASKAGLPMPMIVTKRVSTVTPPTNFFLNSGGMSGFFESVRGDADAQAKAFISEQFDTNAYSGRDPGVIFRI